MPRHTPGQPSLERALSAGLRGEVRFDAYVRHLYATDASMYAIEPLGVAFPRDAEDVVAAVEVARRFDVPVLPRGAGTSLAGQTVGRAVVLDFSRHMHRIVALDAAACTARVQPGVVQDDLNRAAAPHGLMFAPDTSTSNRATLGGMIGNNSCGFRSVRYGMTIDHVASLDVVLSDGSRAHLAAVDADEIARRAAGTTLEAGLYREIPRLIEARADVIRSGFPPHWRRTGGYRLERLLPERGPLNLAHVVVGSEGTLAVVVEATVRLVPRPGAVAALAGHFESVAAAIDAVPSAIESGAAAVELVDHRILELARRSPEHAHLAAVLVGDPGALLWVEFHADTAGEAVAAMAALENRWRVDRQGYAVIAAPTPSEQQGFRELRKAGLGLLTAAGTGGERSLAFVEDTAVDPLRLGEYTQRFREILDRHGLRAGFYGHASAACLHIRPFMDLTRPGQVDVLRAVATEVSELVAAFGGMNSSEHGDGLARAEFSRRLFGDALYDTMREVKRLFDPHGRLNPGRKVDAPAMTEHLRDPLLPVAMPFETHFAYEFADGMRGAANRCARIGACRRTADAGGTMCPSFMATREEAHSTRGRANALVLALSSPDPRAALGDAGLHEVLDLCLECKACRRECPLSIDMARLKAEALAQRHARHGVPLGARLFSHARAVNRLGAALAPLSNLALAARPLRALAERVAGIDRRRPLPAFRRDTLQAWFARRARRQDGRATSAAAGTAAVAVPRGPLVFLADSFASYTEPHIGRAAITLLERAGWDVRLEGEACCGRALISKGLLAAARTRQARLLDRLGDAASAGVPIAGIEPSCVATLRDELPALWPGDARAAAVAERARLAEELLVEALEDGTLGHGATDDAPADTAAARPDTSAHGGAGAPAMRRILFHPHCHQKADGAVAPSVRLLECIPGAQVETLDAGCCGMAGSFGFERDHYDLSMAIGGLRLFPAVTAAPPDTRLAATGVSCRQQIRHGTGRQAEHPVVLLYEALEAGRAR